MPTIGDIERELNNFITFKTGAALGPWQLPTMETARRWLEEYLDDEMLRHHREEDVIRTMLVVRSSKLFDGDYTICVDSLVGENDYRPCFEFWCEVKTIDHVSAIRNVRIGCCEGYEGNPNMRVEDFTECEIERNRDKSIFDLWALLPEERRKKFPICPACGGPASVLMGEHDKYHVWCEAGCGWRSKGHMSDYGEVLSEYVNDWFPKERKHAIKEQKAKARKDEALTKFSQAVLEAKKAGVAAEELSKLVEKAYVWKGDAR